jgi:hypothetical protein
MFNIKNKYKYQQGGFTGENPYLADHNKTKQQVNAGVGAVGAINPIIGAALGAGQMVGNASKDEYGIYKSGLGEFAANSFDPNTGIQNLKDWSKDMTWETTLNQASLGLIGEGASQKRAKEGKRQADIQAKDLQRRAINSQSQAVLSTYPTQGVHSAFYAKYGGKIPTYLTNALAEGGEVMMSATPPQTDSNGNMEKLASNVSKFEGDGHEASSGGIGFKPTSEGIIYSDSLRTPEGLTYAKSAELLGKEKGKWEKKMKNATSEAEYNTAERMITKTTKKLELLFQHQEAIKSYGEV